MKRKVYLHLGETNTGKTYHALQRLMQSSSGIYLAPLRILALEIYEKLNIDQNFQVAVIDEIQMIGDSQRGATWTREVSRFYYKRE